MTFAEYQHLACRTASPETTILVCCLGLIGETMELLTNPTPNEAGDVLWYAVVLASLIPGQPWDNLRAMLGRGQCPVSTVLYASPHEACRELAEQNKKHLGQGHELDHRAITWAATALVTHALVTVSKEINISPAMIMAANIDKLEKRYPNGFSVARSVNRGDIV